MKTTCIIAAAVGLATQAHAVTTAFNFVFNNATANATTAFPASTTSGGGSIVGNVDTVTWTLNNITLDGFGAGDDSITMVFSVTGSGGTGLNAVGGAWGESGNGATTMNNVAESLAFGFTSANVTLGPGGTETVQSTTFLGFNRTGVNNFTAGSETWSLAGGTGADGSQALASTIFTNLVPGFTVGHTGDASTFRVDDVRARFSVVTVPEPSVALLAGLGLLGMVRRRRA